MALPSGVTTATVTFGTDADVLGVGATTTLTITPSHTLIWAATGEIIRAFNVSVDAAANVVGSFEIPHTDQAGFTDELGRAITNWYYTVAGLAARDGETQSYRKVFQVASGVTSMNLDLIPINGTVGATGFAPQLYVTMINGQVGPVTIDADGVGAVPLAQKAAPSGVATLDGDTLVPLEQVPVDAILADPRSTATFAVVVKPEAFGAVADGTTNDAPAITLAIAAAAASGKGGAVLFSAGKTYAIATALVLPSTVSVRLIGEAGAKIKATAAMVGMIRKTGGAGVGGSIESLNLDGNMLADRCVDIEAGLRINLLSGVWANAKVAVADFGRSSGQVYEMTWRDTRVVGIEANDLPNMPGYGVRTGVNVTDSVIDNIVVKSAGILVEDGGSINVWNNVHVFSVGVLQASVGFRVPGALNRLVNCYADTQIVGFDLVGARNSVVNAMFFWLAGFITASTVIGVRISGNGNSVVNPNVRGTYGAGFSGYPFEIGSATPTLIVGANVYADTWTAFWNLTGIYTPTLVGATWDYGAVPAQTTIAAVTLTGEQMNVAKAAGNARELRFLSGTSPRWIERVTNASEAGDSAGSDFEIIAYKDDGSFAFTPYRALRQSGVSILNRGFIRTKAQQSLAANGAVAFDSALSSHHIVALAANATSSTIANTSAIPTSKPTYDGQVLTISWKQDGTGGRTYVWPTNCKFAGNSAPSDTTANTFTSVTFVFDGTRWYETARAVAVPTF